jgi:hypothetical protein
MYLDLKKVNLIMARCYLSGTDVSLKYGCTRRRLDTIFKRIEEGKPVRPATAGKLATALGVDVLEIMKD